MKTALQALLHAQLRQTPNADSARGQDAAGAWTAGELRGMALHTAPADDVTGCAIPVNSFSLACVARTPLCDSWFGPDCQ